MIKLAPATIEAIIQLAAQYGPGIVTSIENLFTKAAPTISDVSAAFANLKPYSAYGIPDIAPTKASVPSVATTGTVPTGIN